MEREDLLLMKLEPDLMNPRLPEVQASQRDAIRAVAKDQGPKLIALAEHIVKYGCNVAELPIVMPSEEEDDRFVVLDGNRRLATLRALETPDILAGVLGPSAFSTLKRLSVEYLKKPIEVMQCAVSETRREADPWIQLRHRGEGGGAGLVKWDGVQSARYDSRMGQSLVHLELLELAKSHGKLPKDVLSKLDKFPITTLQRLVNDPDVRAELGFEIEKGKLLSRYPKKELAKGVARVITDLSRKTVSVTDLKLKHQRLQYAKSIPRTSLPNPKTAGNLRDIMTEDLASGSKKPKPNKPIKLPDQVRETLVPRKCALVIPEKRIRDVLIEMQALHVDQFPNLGAVILRVFVEWSVGAYVKKHKLKLTKNQEESLHHRFMRVLEEMVISGSMTKDELKPIKVEAARQHSILSIHTMQHYVHNTKLHPKANELKEAWDTLQPLFEKIWC